MSPVFPARRRAEKFDRLVETASTSGAGRRRSEGDLDRLADLANGLRDLPQVEPRAAFSAELRERLMAAAASELTPARTKAAPTVADRLTVRRRPGSAQGRRQRRLTVGIATLAIIGGTAGTAVASHDALPGETLYPVKRAIENLQTGFTASDQSKGTSLLSDAGTRLNEVHALTHRGHPAQGDTVRNTLESFSSEATQASDLLLNDFKKHQNVKTIQRLRDFTAQGIDQLSQLQATVPANAQHALSDAAQTLLLIDQAAQALCPDCGGHGITQIPSTLLQNVAQSVSGLPAPGSGTGSSSRSGKQTEADPPAQPPILLPSVDPGQLLPGTIDPSPLLPSPSGGAQQGGGSAGATGGSTKSGDGSSTNSGGGTTGGSNPSPSPSTVGGAVGGVVKGAGDTLDGVVGTIGGLLGGG